MVRSNIALETTQIITHLPNTGWSTSHNDRTRCERGALRKESDSLFNGEDLIAGVYGVMLNFVGDFLLGVPCVTVLYDLSVQDRLEGKVLGVGYSLGIDYDRTEWSSVVKAFAKCPLTGRVFSRYDSYICVFT